MVVMLHLPENVSIPADLVVSEGSGIKNSIDLVASLQAQTGRRKAYSENAQGPKSRSQRCLPSIQRTTLDLRR
jgi:hypothetical protein